MQDVRVYIEELSKAERQQHLDLSTPCEFRGTNSVECRGLLAVVLGTSVPRNTPWIHCCHACHDGRCSNYKHLYWGTAWENIEDAVEAGVRVPPGPRYGVDNGNYKLAPWRNVRGKREDWAFAAEIYDDFAKNGWNFLKHGYGWTFLANRYGLSQGPARTMIQRFREGWIPYDCEEWTKDFSVS